MLRKTRALEYFTLHLRPWVASAGFVPLCLQLATVDELDVLRREIPLVYRLLDGFTLVTHEAGHFFFRILGPFLGIAGGTLLQIILPALFVGSFFRHDYRFGTQCALLLLGQSFISVSIYAADARKRILPLLGDNLDGHDWHNMLRILGLLEADQVFGWCFRLLAWAAFAALVLAPLYMRD